MSGSRFKFGRGYQWRVLNMDFATLYPETMMRFTTEQIGMLTGIPPQFQGRVDHLFRGELGLTLSQTDLGRPERREFRDTIVLTRRDLSREREGKPRQLINFHDFAERSMSREELMRASIVIFMDDDGNTRTIKNRYGPTN